MQVTVTNNNMETTNYGYDPEHYGSLIEFYSNLVQAGEIYTYTIKMQRRVYLTHPQKWDRQFSTGCG